MALRLLRYEDSAPDALAFLRRVLERGFGRSATGDMLCALARAGDRSAQERLYEVAVQSRPSEGRSWLAGIRGLADFDPDAAFTAALRQAERTGSPELPELLMTLNASRGSEVLLQRIVREKRTTMRWAIGRALRWYGDRNQLESRLLMMSRDPDQRAREAAAELCGWQPPGFLAGRVAELVDDDGSKVERAALEALRRQEEQRWSRELLDALASAGVPRSWNLMFAAIDLIDPYLLDRAEDQLCLWPIVDGLPLEYEIAARERLDRRRKELVRAAETEDRHRRPVR